jgi:hypothetical protein
MTERLDRIEAILEPIAQRAEANTKAIAIFARQENDKS